MQSGRTSQLAFVGSCALLFFASAALMIVGCEHMSAMRGMPMPGGWTMSMAWMRMPGQTCSAAAASFLGMWVVMMVAMMLPAVTPRLWHYRQAMEGTGTRRAARLTATVGVAYFLVWSATGMVIYPLGVGLASVEMLQPTLAHWVPLAMGLNILGIGAVQFTRWKAHQLVCCRLALAPNTCNLSPGADAWRHGVRLGVQCVRCCANLMAIALLVGVMDLRAMATVTAAILLERTVPSSRYVTRVIGAVIVAAGLCVTAKAMYFTR
jgi:predicted metal-binding membrane protein